MIQNSDVVVGTELLHHFAYASIPNVVLVEGEKLVRSTKMKALLRHIQQMKNADPTAKCVIFSQWTSFLDILRVCHVRLSNQSPIS